MPAQRLLPPCKVPACQVKENGPAAQDGSPPGSDIAQVEGKAITDGGALASQAPGNKVTVTVVGPDGKQESSRQAQGSIP